MIYVDWREIARISAAGHKVIPFILEWMHFYYQRVRAVLLYCFFAVLHFFSRNQRIQNF